MNPMFNLAAICNDHATLAQNYHNICLLVKDLSEVIKSLERKIQAIEGYQETKVQKVLKKCRYYNTGFCRSRLKCQFLHPDSICQDYLESGKCDNYKTCLQRHPRECNYWRKSGKCFYSCSYLHREVRNESETNDEISDSTEKLVTSESNEKEENVEEIEDFEDFDEDRINAMTTEDFVKMYDENLKDTASKIVTEESIDMSQLEEEPNHAAFDEKNVQTKSKCQKAKRVVKPALKRSSRKPKIMT